MMPVSVRRGDGKTYGSISEAARELAAELGCGDPKYMGKNISSCAHGRSRTAYGYTWEFDETACPCCGRPWEVS